MDNIIYVIDDDVFFAEVLKRKLNLQGYNQVFTCYTGESFLKEMNTKPDIIFLDYDLGDLTGIDVLLKIKKCSPETHVIMVSAHDKKKIIAEANRYGIYRYIDKGENNINQQIEEALSCLLPNSN
jgi:response regulator of citrate/malate metabolism